ncbi:MAG: YvcK family protein [Armatimonadota bacterium]|nr:YvcK family protein [Armatimonadota bacterium]
MRVQQLFSSLKWLYPGMRVKRWLLLIPIGLAFSIAGVVLLANIRIVDVLGTVGREAFRLFGLDLTKPAVQIPTGVGLVVLGVLLVFVSLRQVVRSITSVVSPEAQGKLADVVFQRRYLAQGERIVVIGGGTGLSTMLRGLKKHTSNIVAVVTVTDDGGSSGRLQKEMGVLPPGDIRNCLVALADAEPMMTRLLQYRFGDETGGLSGHSFGNLLIAAMTHITGDFEKAVKETSSILAIRGRVLPSTLDNVKLRAQMADGTIVDGETNITKYPGAINRVMLNPPDVKPLDETLKAIELADCIVIGPGSVYTSIVPNLLVEGIPEAIRDSDAIKVYVCNVMTQPGETDGYKASDHVRAVASHAACRVFDYVLINQEKPTQELLDKYAAEKQYFVEPDAAAVREMGYRPVIGNYISQTDVVRHDPDKLAEAILKLVY